MICGCAAILSAAVLLAELPELVHGRGAPAAVPAEIVGESATIKLKIGRPLMMRTKADIHRTALAADDIVELSQFTPREISLVGRRAGKTTVTFWFSDADQPPVSYVLEVVVDP
jgi:Flp pilus assembly secretin CpaC